MTGVFGRHVAVHLSERKRVARISSNRATIQIGLATVQGQRAAVPRASGENFKLAARGARCYSASPIVLSVNEHGQADGTVNHEPETSCDQAPFQQKNMCRAP